MPDFNITENIYGNQNKDIRFAARHAFDRFRAANDPSLNPRERMRIKSRYYDNYNKVSNDLKYDDANRDYSITGDINAGYPEKIDREEFDPIYRNLPKVERPKYVARREFETKLKSILSPNEFETINKIDVLDLFSNAAKEDKARNDAGEMTYFDDIINTDKGRDRIKSIISSINSYNSNIWHVNTIRASLNDSDRAIYDAYNRFKSGKYRSSQNGGTIYEDKAIELFNKYFSNDVDHIDIHLEDEAFDNYNKLLQDKSIIGLNASFKISDNHTIRVTRQNAGILPILFKGISEAERIANNSVGGTIQGDLLGIPGFNIKAYDKQNNEIYKGIKEKDSNNWLVNFINNYNEGANGYTKFNDRYSNSYNRSAVEYARLYDEFLEQYSDVSKRNNLDRFKIQILGTGMPTFGRAGYFEQYEKGMISLEDYKKLSDDNDARVINATLYGGDWYNARVYEVDEASNYNLQDGTKNYEYRDAIRAAIDKYKSGAKDNLKLESVFLPGIYDADGNPAYGYKITLPRQTIKREVGDDKKEYTDHRAMQFIITGLGNESFADDYVRDENYKALVTASTIAETKSSRLLTDGATNRQLGDIRINGYDSDNIGIKLLGQEVIVDKQSAQQFIKYINEYNSIKDSINIYGEARREWLEYIQEIATNISPYTNLNSEQLTQLLIENL